jgi:hypothetical protein
VEATLTRAKAAGGRAGLRTAPDRLLTSITMRPPTDSNLPALINSAQPASLTLVLVTCC